MARFLLGAALMSRLVPLSLLLTSLASSPALAQTGVSDDRVALPEGPGSVGGVGDGALLDRNHGSFRYTYELELPRGQGGLGPSLSLRYDSGAGSGLAGIGWRFELPSVERSTSRGLPRYDASDRIVAHGAEELVRVGSSGGAQVYRARFERDFVRWTWSDAGSDGYWTAEYPDGTTGYFGADRSGGLVPEARLSGESGVFRWYLVELVDTHQHRVLYTWERRGAAVTPARIEWGASASGGAIYRVDLSYEPRDDLLSSARAGFEEVLADRLARIELSARGARVRSWRLTYEPESASGGLSRLARIERLGSDGASYPVSPRMTYSRSLAGVCPKGDCDRPFVVEMGELPGVGVTTGATQLVDLDGDALPDLVDASQPGPHRIFLNRLESEGRAHFAPTVGSSAAGTQNAFPIGDPRVQVLDLDGDGLADLFNAATGRFLANDGSGDWVDRGGDAGTIFAGAFEADADDSDLDPRRTRFLDLDGDRRIDVLRTAGGQTLAYVHGATGFEALGASDLGREFDADRLDLADLNGDGLLDPVVLEADGSLRFRINLGFARWTDWRVAAGPRLDPSDLPAADLQDLNGDGLADLVAVGASRIRYSLNQSGGRFAPFAEVDASGVDGALPARGPTTAVLFADMNGTGSDDVVWIEPSGSVRYLELFPVRPNLLVRVENGIGWVQEVTYSTAAFARAGAEPAWVHTLPMAVNIVTALDTWVTSTGGEDGAGLHEVTTLGYRDGWYDGRERQLRGFARVEEREDGGDGGEASITVLEYDLGVDDPYRAGLLLRRATFAGGSTPRPLEEERRVWGECPVDQVPEGLAIAVRHLCEQETTRIVQEGAPPEGWYTLRTEQLHDGFGNVIVAREHGVVHRGPPESPAPCGPCTTPEGTSSGACGPQCLGDESVEERELIEPVRDTGGRWILGVPHTITRGDGVTAAPAIERFYYDGPAFLGLPLGSLERGVLTRREEAVEPGRFVTPERRELDAHGNPRVLLGALGSPDLATDHRRELTYDADGLHPVRIDVPLSSGVTLRRELSFDPTFDLPASRTAWMIAGEPGRAATDITYDTFGRPSLFIEPGDTIELPTRTITYELAAPASRAVVRRRAGAGELLEDVTCYDGLGRTYETRTKVRAGEYLVSRHLAFDRRGRVVRVHAPRTERDGACALAEPAGTPFESRQYDPLGRPTTRILPAGVTTRGATRLETTYAPLSISRLDGEDTAAGSLTAGTPVVTRLDGLGRVVALERSLSAGAEPAVTRLLWDARGHSAGAITPDGAILTETRDLLGRLIEVVRPDTGRLALELDDAGRVVRSTDARGRVTRTEYDGLGRRVAEWDEADPSTTEIELEWDRLDTCAAESCAHGAGRLARVEYPVAAGLSDLLGGEAAGRDELEYDGRGRLIRATRVIAGAKLVTEHHWDGGDRELATTWPDGQRSVRTFDGASRLVAIEGLIDRVRHEERGRIASIDHADGSGEVLEWTDREELARLAITGPDGTSMVDRRFTRDHDGRITAIRDATPASPALSAEAEYTLDAWSRLTGARLVAGEETLSFSYDAIGALARATSGLGASSAAHVGEYEYDRPGVPRSAGAEELEHDAAGYLVRRGQTRLTWDFLGRLTAASSPERTHVYGAGSELVARAADGGVELIASPDLEVRDGITVRYERVAGSLAVRVESATLAALLLGDPSGDGTVDAGDAWLAHASRSGLSTIRHDGAAPSVLLRSAARRLLLEARGPVTHLHADHRGSPTLATRSGEIAGARSYYPYGALRAEDGFVDERGLEGQPEDRALGLTRFPARWLDARRGQWASADPAFLEFDASFFVESTNRFGYALSSPIDVVDPTGLVGQSSNTRAPAANRASLVRSSMRVSSRNAPRIARAASSAAVRPPAQGNVAQTRNGGDARLRPSLKARLSSALKRLVARFRRAPRAQPARGAPNPQARNDAAPGNAGVRQAREESSPDTAAVRAEAQGEGELGQDDLALEAAALGGLDDAAGQAAALLDPVPADLVPASNENNGGPVSSAAAARSGL